MVDIVEHARKLRADLCDQLPNGVGNTIDALIAEVTAAEQRGAERQRERDAKLAENHFGDRADMQSYAAAGQRIAQAIRQEPTT